MSDDKRPVLELRNATIAEVRFPDRIITLVAVPYDKPALVPFKGRVWEESFSRGAFKGIEERAGRVRVNREHRKGSTVGKAVRFAPDSTEGLVTELKIAETPAGDESLALAAEDMISSSVGFGVRGSDQELDPRPEPPRRYIRRAFLDHIALVEDPAYDAAGVLSVRGNDDFIDAATLPAMKTPVLDEWAAYLAARRLGAAS